MLVHGESVKSGCGAARLGRVRLGKSGCVKSGRGRARLVGRGLFRRDRLCRCVVSRS